MFNINGSPVERVVSFKYLGVHIPEGLTWWLHTVSAVRKKKAETVEEIPGILSNTEEFQLLHHQEHPDVEHHCLVQKQHQTGLQGPANSPSFS